MAESVWPTIHAERKALADDVANLSAEQWKTPSLCSGWNVHEVLAHQLSAAKMTPPKFFAKLAAAGFNFDKYAAPRPGRRTPGSARPWSTARTSAGRWGSSASTRWRR